MTFAYQNLILGKLKVIRQIQADALRHAAQKLHDETYAGMTRLFIERILIEEANQLDPIPTPHKNVVYEPSKSSNV